MDNHPERRIPADLDRDHGARIADKGHARVFGPGRNPINFVSAFAGAVDRAA